MKIIELAKKYLLMYLEFKYELNFDKNTEDYKELSVQILTQKNVDPETLDLEDINTYNILGLYCEIIKNDIKTSYNYSLKEIEAKFNTSKIFFLIFFLLFFLIFFLIFFSIIFFFIKIIFHNKEYIFHIILRI